MQKKVELYIFNPEHDMALANFSPYYMPPQEIIHMKEDLCFLPVWYASEDSYISIYDKGIISTFNGQISSFKRFSEERFVDDFPDSEIIPWGWNPSLVHSLLSSGVLEKQCPDTTKLERIHYLSGRQQCIDVLDSLSSIEGTCGKAYQCNNISDIKNLLNTHPQVVFKSPWSGSGKGLTFTSVSTWNDNIEKRLLRIIRSQGCIMAEPVYNKVLDFAMEFYSDNNGSISFIGYSMFNTDAHGSYKSNILMSNELIEQRLSEYISSSILSEVRDSLIKKLGTMFSGDYTGYFGVDMMICDENGRYLLHPCVEINLRMNMGVVSRILFDRYVKESSTGKFAIEHYISDGEALAVHNERASRYPLVKDNDGKIISGYLPLTPIIDSTRYAAYIYL